MANVSSAGNTSTEAGNSAAFSAAEDFHATADAALLLRGSYVRQGSDLVVQHPDHGKQTILDYFSQEHLPGLETADRALLKGDAAGRFAGPLALGRYARAGATGAAKPIGNVQAAKDSATAFRTPPEFAAAEGQLQVADSAHGPALRNTARPSNVLQQPFDDSSVPPEVRRASLPTHSEIR